MLIDRLRTYNYTLTVPSSRPENCLLHLRHLLINRNAGNGQDKYSRGCS